LTPVAFGQQAAFGRKAVWPQFLFDPAGDDRDEAYQKFGN
jgi:hypothetical protein